MSADDTAKQALKGVTDLFLGRLGRQKEYLMEQLRVAIRLPRYPPANGYEGLEEERSRAIEWIVGKVLEMAQSISSWTNLSRSDDAIRKEQGGGEEHNVMSTDAKKESVGST